MKKTGLASVVLFAGISGICFASDTYRPILLSLRPAVDIPLPPDTALFRLGAGATVIVSYVLPFFRPLSVGISANYRLGRMQHAELGNLGSLSVLSAEATTEFRLAFLRFMEIWFSAGAGYFYAFQNHDPSSWATNLVFSGRIGVGVRAAPRLTMSLQGEYRRYQSLSHLLGVGLGADFRLGGAKQEERRWKTRCRNHAISKEQRR